MTAVLQFINSFHQGGSERQAVQLTRLLCDSGRYRVYVACLDSGGVLRDEVSRLGLGEIPEYRLSSFYDRNMIVQLTRAARLLRRRQIQVVQTHDFYTNVFGILVARIAGVPARIAARRETAGLRTGAQKRVERGIYRMAHAVVANAAAVAQQLTIEGVPARKIVTIHNGLDSARLAPAGDFNPGDARRSFGLPDDRRFVTIVANFRHDVKDHSTFLRAAKRVRSVVPDAGFVLAGEGELLESVRAQARELGLENDLFFTGRCGAVAELLAISDVCVLSSRAEGFSNSILEYMAAGRPVVATAVGGACEAVIDGETGFLVDAGDDQSMADRITRLLGNTGAANEMGRRGKLRVEQHFSCTAQLEKTEEMYDRLLERARAGKQWPAGDARAERSA